MYFSISEVTFRRYIVKLRVMGRILGIFSRLFHALHVAACPQFYNSHQVPSSSYQTCHSQMDVTELFTLPPKKQYLKDADKHLISFGIAELHNPGKASRILLRSRLLNVKIYK